MMQSTSAWGFGVKGSDTYADTSTHEGDWMAIQALTDAEINAVILGTGHTGAAAWAGLALTAGTRIDGIHITSIDLTSGSVILWRRS